MFVAIPIIHPKIQHSLICIQQDRVMRNQSFDRKAKDQLSLFSLHAVMSLLSFFSGSVTNSLSLLLILQTFF